MVWAILAVLGVPLWLCALGILALVLRNRGLRKRHGDVPGRMRSAPGGRWHRGHAVWAHDVFVFRGSPAAWKEELIWVTALTIREAEAEQPRGPKGLHKLGEHPVIASLTAEDGTVTEFATKAKDAALVSGPFETTVSGPAAPQPAAAT